MGYINEMFLCYGLVKIHHHRVNFLYLLLHWSFWKLANPFANESIWYRILMNFDLVKVLFGEYVEYLLVIVSYGSRKHNIFASSEDTVPDRIFRTHIKETTRTRRWIGKCLCNSYSETSFPSYCFCSPCFSMHNLPLLCCLAWSQQFVFWSERGSKDNLPFANSGQGETQILLVYLSFCLQTSHLLAYFGPT